MSNLKWEDLTPKERWKYVNQDFVRKYELLPRGTIGDIIDEDESFWGCVNLEDSNKLRFAIIGLHKDGKSTEEIAYHVPLSYSQIYRILEDYRNEPILKEKILELHKEGLTKKQILYKLKCAKNYIDQVLRESSVA